MCFNPRTWATRLYLLCFLLSFPLLDFGQQFQRQYEPSNSAEYFNLSGFNGATNFGRDRVRPTSDGGYIRIASVDGASSTQDDIVLIKLDGTGAVSWTQRIAGSHNDYPTDVQQTNDGGYVICGHTRSGSQGSKDAFLLKTDGQGNVQWTKSYGTSADEQADCLQIVPGGYLIAGFTKTIPNANEPSAMMLRTDANGNVLHQLILKNTGNGTTRIKDIILDKSGGFLAIAQHRDDALLISTTGQLQLSWVKRIEEPGPINTININPNTIRLVPGGCIVVGTITLTIPSLVGESDIFVLKTDDWGNPLWAKRYDPGNNNETDNGTDVLVNSDGLIIAGTREVVPQSGAQAGYHGYLLALDLNGNVTWDKSYNLYSGNTTVHSLDETADGGIIMAGSYYSSSNGHWVSTVTKTNPVGVSGCGDIDLSTNTIQINPTENSFSPTTYSGIASGSFSIAQPQMSLNVNTPCLSTCQISDFNVEILGNPVLCDGATSTVLTASSSNGSAPFTYVWSDGSDDASLTASAPGTYAVTLSDNNGCWGTAEVTVTTANSPQVNLVAFPGNSVCQGESIGLVAFFSSPTPVSFAWYEANAPSTILGTNQSFVPATNAAGSFNYCVEVNSGNGCPTTECINTTVNAIPSIQSLNAVYCEGGAPDPIGGTASLFGLGTFTSNPAGAVSSTQAGSFTFWTFNPSVGSGTYEVTYCQTGSGCCVSQMVTVEDEPENITYGQICSGEPCVNLNSLVNVPGATFSGPGVSGNQFCPNSLSAGYYTVDYCIPSQAPCNGCAEITFQVIGSNGGWPKLAAAPNQNIRNEVGEAMVQGPDGSFYMTGFFNGSIEFDQNHQFNALNANGSGQDMWVVKYSECGVEWAITASNHLGWLSNRSAIPTDILIYKGRVFISVNVKTNNISKGHLVALNATDGSLNVNFGDQIIGTTQPNQTLANRIAVRPEILSAKGGGQQDLIYVTGAVQGRISFAIMNQVPNSLYQSIEGTNDIYLATYDMAGGQYFMTTQGGKGEDFGHGIDVFADGSSVIAGEVTGQASGGSCSWPMPVINNGTGASSDVFLARYNPNGCESWMLMNGSSKDDRAIDVKIDANNNVLVLGTYERTFSPVQFGLGSTIALNGVVGDEDLFLVRYHGPTGAGMNGVGIGSSWNQDHVVRPHSLWYERSTNSAYASGYFKGTLSFAGSSFATNSINDSDPFVMRFEANSLNQDWAAQGKTPANGNDRDLGTDVIGDGLGNAYLTGGFRGQIGFSPQPVLSSEAFTDFFAVRVGNNGSFYKTVESEVSQLEQSLAGSELTIHPNPNNGHFKVQLVHAPKGQTNLTIVDLKGRVLANQVLEEGVQEAQFELEGLSKGVYFLKYTNGATQLNRRVIVQ